MRKHLLTRYPLFAVVVLTLALTTLTSCDEDFGKTAYRGLLVTVNTYDVAMKSANRLYAEKFITPEQMRVIWDGAEALYLAQKAALDALRIYEETKSIADKDKTIVAIGLTAKRLSAFMQLVQPFVSKAMNDELGKALTGLEEVK